MAATAERIGFITQAARIASSGPTDSVVFKYGERARDVDEPLETFFDNMNDVQAICDARHALLSADRRRFQQQIAGEATGLALDYSQLLPTVQVVDEERAADMPALVCEIGVDFEREATILSTWG